MKIIFKDYKIELTYDEFQKLFPLSSKKTPIEDKPMSHKKFVELGKSMVNHRKKRGRPRKVIE